MAKFYSEVSYQDFVTQPQLIRWRSRYRGQRESFKMNSEMKAFQFDIAKLYHKMADISEAVTLDYNTLNKGGSFDDTSYTSEDLYGNATMGEVSTILDTFGEGNLGDQEERPLSIAGAMALFARIEAMRSRFRRARTLGD